MPSFITCHIFLFHVPSFFVDLLEMYCLIRIYLKTQRLWLHIKKTKKKNNEHFPEWLSCGSRGP